MHSYSTDGQKRENIYLALALISIGLAWCLGAAFNYFSFTQPWWLDTPAVLGFFGLLWRLYDTYLWKIRIGTLSVGGIANYSGNWAGSVISDYSGGTQIPARLQIEQTATRILITLTAADSSSTSTMCLVRSGGSQGGLHYCYMSEPLPLAASTMNTHRGYARINFDNDPNRLIGEYRSDGRRGTSGRLVFDRC